ncbi:MAG: hypothetical protein H6673_08560 [Anaerolineales bacterium]|nr:hypothetical protein [Anaerolineales bacterium]
MKRTLSFIIVLLISSFPLSLTQAKDTPALVIRSVGVIDLDGTVLYSVLVATGPDTLTSVTITSPIPMGTTFIESPTTPEGAVFVGEVTGVVTWELETLEADTIMGPFTYRVSAENDTPLPRSPNAQVTWVEPNAGSIAINATEDTLQPFAETGMVNFDAEGTLNIDGENAPVPVGETGIYVFVPSGVVSELTTMAFTRMIVNPDLLPSDSADSWWCTVFSITLEPDVELSANTGIVFSVPSRKTISPGQPALIFVGNTTDDGATYTWEPLANPETESEATGAFIGPDGTSVVVTNAALWADLPDLIALGTTNPPFRAISGGSLSIIDGTSNTIFSAALPYIEQDNIIAILIG